MKSFHPDAANNFNEKGHRLVDRMTAGDLSASEDAPYPTPFISAEFTEEDIRSFGHFSRADASGVEKARYFEHGDEIIGFEGDAYRDFLRLAEQVHRTKAMRDVISFETCRELVMDWFKLHVSGSDVDLAAFLENRRDELVSDHVVVLPVHELILQEPFTIGRVELRPLTRQQIEEWMDELAAKQPEGDKYLAVLREKLAKPFQGRAASWFAVRAERRRAFEVAQRETRRALSALRLFSKAALFPNLASYCVPWGEQHVVQEYHIAICDGEFVGPEARLVAPLGTFWTLPQEDIAYCWERGLGDLSDLLQQETPTPLEAALMEAVMVYSRATLTSDATDKLLHIFVALESLLLKDPEEPVVSAISDRVAFIAGRSVEERLSISALVKTVYGFRSRYVHHALRVDDREKLQTFMLHAWDVLMSLLAARHEHKELSEVHQALDRRKFQ